MSETAELAHIVRQRAELVQAIADRSFVTALCGVRWVPSWEGSAGKLVCADCVDTLASELKAERLSQQRLAPSVTYEPSLPALVVDRALSA